MNIVEQKYTNCFLSSYQMVWQDWSLMLANTCVP